MMQENNDLGLNNPAPAPIPEPLPEFRRERLDGGFSGAINRFCSNDEVEPVTEMPDYTIGKKTEKPKNLVAKSEKKAKKSDKKKQESEKEPIVVQQNFQPVPDFEPVMDSGQYTENQVIPPVQTFQNTEVYNQNSFRLPKEEKKPRTGVVILISVMATVLILAGVFFGIELVNNNNSKGNSPFEDLYPEENTTENAYATIPSDYDSFYDEIQKKTEGITVAGNNDSKYANKKWKGISLNPQPKSKKEYSAQYSFERVSPSTVAVLSYTDKITEDSIPDGQGTGMVISSDGYIVTNSHVIGDSKDVYYYQVIDAKGKKYTANVVGFDTRTDIAVLKIKAKGLKPVEFSKLADLKIGDDIIAVGNPGGIKFQNSLTKGIISAKDRTLPDSNVTYIQTDAAINPGNSGGPLCNLYGQVVGITTAKINSSMYEGMGFAIPSDTVKKIADSIIKNGYVKDRVKIGIVGTVITEYAAQMYNIPTGVMITSIDSDSDLNKTDVKPKDIITRIDDKKVQNFSEIYAEIDTREKGDTVKIEIFRPSSDKNKKGDTFTVEVTLTNN